MKVMIVMGTRPEMIKLAPVISEAKRRENKIELLLCSTGQHREMLDQAMSVFNVTPDIELDIMCENQSLSELTSRLIDSLSKGMSEKQPDVVVVQGDTASAFTAALAAFYLHIPVAHVEAGLRTGDINSPFPEELNRVMIGRIAHWHFTPTLQAKNNLIKEGVESNKIFITGNTVVDAIEMVQSTWKKSSLKNNFPNYFPGKKLVLITTHRRENFGQGLEQICLAIKTLCARFTDHGFIFPVHLNPQVRQVVFKLLDGIENLKLLEPIDFDTCLFLQSQVRLVITDSGGIQEEAPSFSVPTVVVRDATERTEGIEQGFAILAGVEADSIIQAAENYLMDEDIHLLLSNKSNPYGDGKAGKRIISGLLDQPEDAFLG